MYKSKKTSLKQYNSFGIDVNSTDFKIAKSQQELKSFLKEKENPIILGGGTNILFKKNIDRCIIKLEIKGIEITNITENYVYINVGAGENWNDLVLWLSLIHI